MEEDLERNAFWVWWVKYGNHLTAPLILIALIILIFQIVDDNQLKKQISENCGWGDEEWECYCEKTGAYKIKQQMYNQTPPGISNLNLTNWSQDAS